MAYKIINNIPVWGEPISEALDQITNCAKNADYAALMADHHLGYAVPIGGVVAYRDKISPSGVGFDIACGNKAMRLDVPALQVKENISLFEDDQAWNIKEAKKLKSLAQSQLGTIGSGNHYVDIFIDEQERIWVGVHFGSRGFGHHMAEHFIKAGGGKDGMFVDPVLLDIKSNLGQEYIACMKLAGRYAYAGRDWVCNRMAKLLGTKILEEIHNHHNFVWLEKHNGEQLWVVRKGATPAFKGQKGFVGGSMGDISVIIEGVDSPESPTSLYSTVHGAGRVMSRTAAAGRFRGRRRIGGLVTRNMMMNWIKEQGVELRGAGTDESPHCYKRLPEVLEHHKNSIRVFYTLKPLGLPMVGENEFDPYKD